MKKNIVSLLSVLLLCTTTIVANGQSALQFKGIPLNTSVDNFSRQLEKKGFKRKQSSEVPFDVRRYPVLPNSSAYYVYFKGSFFSDGTYPCYICARYDEYTNIVTGVDVDFGSGIDDSDAFKHFVNLYTEKYGIPTIQYLIFSDVSSSGEIPYSSLNDISKDNCVNDMSKGNCNGTTQYFVDYSLSNGSIRISYGVSVKYEEFGTGKHTFRQKYSSDTFGISYYTKREKKKINEKDEL